MGSYKNVASWIATEVLGATRSARQVEKYLTAMVVRFHRHAVENGKTTHSNLNFINYVGFCFHELPSHLLGMTQAEAAGGDMDEGGDDSTLEYEDGESTDECSSHTSSSSGSSDSSGSSSSPSEMGSDSESYCDMD
jgi:hypothetical protein